MRNICLLLILLNLMVFGYQQWILQPSAATRIGSAEPDIPLLQLANQPALTETGSEVEVTEFSVSPRCLRLGPFANREAAQAVQRDLRKRGAAVTQSVAEGQVWVGHWVQVADQKSRAGAEAARSKLSANDLETYILPDDSTYALSLGIYRKRASAESVLSKARRLGYKALMVDRFQPGTLFWLQVSLDDGAALQPGEFQGDAGQILRTEEVNCPESAS